MIGCGAWGRVHALALQAMGSGVRRFFASRTTERARDFARTFSGEDAFDSPERAFADPRVSAVVIVTPHDSHAPLARAALHAGKHVLVEKPIALTLDDATHLVELAAEKGLCLAVAEEYRLSPLVRALHEAVADGLIGRVVFAHASAITRFEPTEPWKRDRHAAGGGVLLDVGIHYIDLLRSLFGEPGRIFALAPGGEHGPTELAVSALISFDNDVSAHVAVTWCGQRVPPAPNLELVGEEGALMLDFRRPWLVHATRLQAGHWSERLRAGLPWRIRRRVPGLLASLPEARCRRIRVPSDDLIGSHALIQDYFAAFTGQRAPAVSGVEGTRDLAVVLAGYDSVRTASHAEVRDPFQPLQRSGAGRSSVTGNP